MKVKSTAKNRLRGTRIHMDAPLPPTSLVQPAPTAKWGDKLHHKGINFILIIIGSILFLGLNIGAYYFGTKSKKSSDSSTQNPIEKAGASVMQNLFPTNQKISLSPAIKESVPKITDFTITPSLSTGKKTYTMTIALSDINGITNVWISLPVLRTERPKPLQLIKGDKKNGTWRLDWTLELGKDPLQFVIKAQNKYTDTVSEFILPVVK